MIVSSGTPGMQTHSVPKQAGSGESGRQRLRAAAVIGALGVVFGDIGTSPIYTIQTVFNPADPHPVPLNDANLLGVISVIFWSVMLIVTLTYVTLVMRIDTTTARAASWP